MARMGWIAGVAAALLLCGCGGDDLATANACVEEGSICKDGRVCLGQRCVPCTEAAECGVLACVAGRCRACSASDQCGAGRVCEQGACRGCAASSECPMGLACVEGGCYPCGSSADCGDGRACVQNVCQPCENSTQCDSGLVCRAGSCLACASTDECSLGRACIEGRCADCTVPEQCLAGQACVAGRCGTCSSSAQCAEGLVCSNGVCLGCSEAVPCGDGMVCTEGRCTGCRTTADCRAGKACVNGRCGPCAETGQCLAGSVCVQGVCGPCLSSDECPNGGVCIDRACRSCLDSRECADGRVCQQGACTSCTSTDQCLDAKACVSGRCAPCTHTNQCTGGRVCTHEGKCESCASGEECEPGLVCKPSTQRCEVPGAPDHLEIVGGDSQSGTVATQLPEPLRVRVVDAGGDPVPGVMLSFIVATGGGSVGSASVSSDRAGLVSNPFTLGTAAGAQTVTVGRQGTQLPDVAGTGRKTVTFTATARAAAADHLETAAGAGQSATVGTALATSPKVRVLDRHGNAVAGKALSFTVVVGGGSVGSASVSSDDSGFASTTFTLGTVAGANTLRVAGAGGDLPDDARTGRASVTFAATATAGPADHLQKVAGDGRTGVVGARLDTDLKVRVLDRHGNPVTGTVIAFTTGTGSLGSATATSDAQGYASTSFTLGTVAGTQSAVAQRQGAALPDVAGTGNARLTFTATAVPDEADHLDVVEGHGQSAILGTRLAIDPQVRVRDRYGNAVAGTTIAFSVTAGGGSASPATDVSDANGAAATSFTLGFQTGTHRLVAQRQGTALPDRAATGRVAITFSANALAPSATDFSPAWLPAAGGTLTIAGANLGADAVVKIGDYTINDPSIVRTPTQIVVTAPSLWNVASLGLGNHTVTVATGGSTLVLPAPLLYVPKFTPKIDGTVAALAADRDWLPQSKAGTNSKSATQAWAGNWLTDLYMAYDDANLYIGVSGRAESQNAIIGYIHEDALARGLSEISSSGDDYCSPGAPPSPCLDKALSSMFNVTDAGFRAQYAFGTFGNQNIHGLNPAGVASDIGVRDLANPANLGWSSSRVLMSASGVEFEIPWSTFARDATGVLRKVQAFVRIVRSDGWDSPADQSLPEDPNASSTDFATRAKVSRAAAIDVRGVSLTPQ